MATLSMLALALDDADLFEDMVLPVEIDPTVMIPNLLVETAELEVIYPDWQTMHDAIGYWSASRIYAWESIAAATYKTGYDPYINVSRDESRTIQTYSTDTGTGKVSAWDDTGFTNRNQMESNGNSTVTETYHVEGDSAVNDSQDIIRKETEVRLKYDLMRIIIDEFKNRFCLAVY